MTEEIGSALIQGAIDFYVHASPDPIPRRHNDIELAEVLKSSGLAGAVHRHHSCSTVERSELVREVTGFSMVGAVEISGPAGGLDPHIVEAGLWLGAPVVALPMLSGSGFREHRAPLPFDCGDIPLLDEDGRPVPALLEILDLVAGAGATLLVGYLVPDELIAVVELCVARGVQKVVLSNPIGRGYAIDRAVIEKVAGLGPLVVEFSVHQLHDFSRGDPPVSYLDEAVALIRSLGVSRAVVSSDGGAASGPAPHELLAKGCTDLVRRGFSESDVRRMVTENPAALLA